MTPKITLSETRVVFTTRIITNKQKMNFDSSKYIDLKKNEKVNEIYQNLLNQFEYDKNIKKQNSEVNFSFVPLYIRQALDSKNVDTQQKYQGTCSDFGDLFRKNIIKTRSSKGIYRIMLLHKNNKRKHDATLIKYFNDEWGVISSITEKGTYQGPLSKKDLLSEFKFT